MQIRKGLWASLILLLFFFQNCSKNDRTDSGLPAAQSSIISVDLARAWANSNLSPKVNSRQGNSNYIGSPAWNRKKEILVPSGEGILKVALEKYAVPFGYRDLLFQAQADGSTRTIVQEVHADSAYLSAKVLNDPAKGHGVRYYIHNEDFSGDVIYFEPLTNRFLFGWRFENGQPKYRLKPIASTTGNARRAGTPKDDDESGDDDSGSGGSDGGGGGGGGEDPGWKGTGSINNGYTIEDFTIAAPAPPKHNPPPYIPPTPTSDPGPINPPTIPVGGGGNQAGGNGGPKNDPKADENYEDSKAPEAAIPCPISFYFIKTGDWQSAVISNYYFEYDERVVSGRFFTINIGAIEVGMPRLTYDGSLIQPDVAQRIAAQAATFAEQQTLALITAYLIINPKATQRDIDNNPLYLQAFKEDYRNAINEFLRADYGYNNNASPASVSTSQAQFVLKDKTKWQRLKFRGRDC